MHSLYRRFQKHCVQNNPHVSVAQIYYAACISPYKRAHRLIQKRTRSSLPYLVMMTQIHKKVRIAKVTSELNCNECRINERIRVAP